MKPNLRVPLLLALLMACSTKAPPGSGGSGGSGGTGGDGGTTQEICDNGADDDGNDLADCADPACASDPHCPFCGDGLRQDPELCDGDQLGDASCLSQHFNGGGRLACKADCTFDTTGCTAHEDCTMPGDEDGNGLSDCQDPTCARADVCLVVSFIDPPAFPLVSSAVTLQVKLVDGSGTGVAGRTVHLTGPPGASIPEAPLVTGVDGIAAFGIHLGRRAVTQTYLATVDGSQKSADLALQALDPAVGHVHTVVNADHQVGGDSSGGASGAHVGTILDIQVAQDGTLYLAESCRILAVSQDGALSVVAGTGKCGSAADGTDPLAVDLSVAALALDEKRSRLVFLDPAAGTVRGIPLGGGLLSTLAGGGTGPDGGPAVQAALTPNAVAVAPDGTLYISDSKHVSVRKVTLDGTISTALASPTAHDWPCGDRVALRECTSAACRPVVDAGGNVFVSGKICGGLAYPTSPDSSTPGMLRIGDAGVPPGLPTHILGNATGLYPVGQRSTVVLLDAPPVAAFDPAGNLFAIAGKGLLQVDDRTWATTSLSTWAAPSFAGEDVPLRQASFANPAAMAFAPNGDLYIADTYNAAVRRVVGLGASKLAPLTVTITAGQNGTVDVGQKPPKLGVKIEDKGKALAGFAVGVVPDDPGIAVYPASTGDDGTATFDVRMGIIPGEHTVQVSLADLHGGMAPDAGVFHLTAKEPPPGTVFSLTGTDAIENYDFEMLPGQVLNAMTVDLVPQELAVAPDGVVFVATSNRQILKVSPDGTLELLGGIAGGGSSDGDGGPAIYAHLDATVMAASRDAVYFVDNSGSRRIRVIDRATGIVDAYEAWSTDNLGVGADGALYADLPEGISRVDPLTRNATVIIPVVDDCSLGDGLTPGAHPFAVAPEGIAFTGTICQGGLAEEWIAWADKTTGKIEDVSRYYGYDMTISPSGWILFSGGGSVVGVDRAMEFGYFLGGGDQFAEDVPFDKTAAWGIGSMGFDAAGHLYVIANERVRIVW